MNNCVNILKIGLKNKKKGFIVQNNKKNVSLLREFIKIGVLKYILIKNNSIVGFINYNNNKPLFNNIINYVKPSNKKYISLKVLKKLLEKQNWIFILSTNKGILNSFDAIKLKTGGLLIAQIWN